MALWETTANIAQALGEDRPWCLVGGLMVALFALEAGKNPRATTDIDILGDARQRPSVVEWAAKRLDQMGDGLHEVTGFEREKGFRFNVAGQVVDILAPDGLGKAAGTVGGLQTIQIPGDTQALSRTEVVELVVGDTAVRFRRPTLIAAILLKARSLPVHSQPEDQREDLVMLLGLLDDPRRARQHLSRTELRWLRRIEDRLDLSNPAFAGSFDEGHIRAARAAYAMLVGQQG
ncbi:MAG: hypothetical protein ACYDA6_04875 [Solirubrobacteraceae bacterium]